MRRSVEEAVLDHPSQSRERRFLRDQLLRSWGFRIKSRRRGQPPLWELDGMVYAKTQALHMIGAPDPGNHGWSGN